MSDSKQPTNDIDALASKAQAMLARVKASADPLASTGLTSSGSTKTAPSVDEKSPEAESVATESAKDRIETDAPTKDPVETGKAKTEKVDTDTSVDADTTTETADLDSKITADIDSVESKATADAPYDLDSELTADIDDLDSKTDADVDDGELATDIDTDLDSELTADIDNLDSKITADIDDLDSKITADIDDLDSKITADFDELDSKVTADIDADLVDAEVAKDASTNFSGSTPLITAPSGAADVADLDVAAPEAETPDLGDLGKTPVESFDSEIIADETISEIEDLKIDVESSLEDAGPTEIPRGVGEEPSISGLGLDDDGSFDNLEFRDVLGDQPSTSEAEFAAAYDSSLSEGRRLESADLTKKMVPVPAPTVDGDVSDLFDAQEVEAAPPKKRELNPLLLLLILVPLLVLVFFGDQFLDRDADENVAVETDATEPEAPDATEPPETTEAPTTAETTTAAPSTTEAPVTVPPTQSAWDLLGESSNTGNFTNLAAPFGLEALLEGEADGEEATEFTVFAPSDAALAALTPEQLGVLTADPEAASRLIDYHIVEQRLNPEDLAEAGTLQTRSGLPIEITRDGDTLILNGSVQIPAEALESETGNVFVIGNVLQPPSVNEALDLGNITFETLSNLLTPAGITELDRAVEFFNENPDVNAVIEGHTDTDGSPDGNQRLSDRRARAVVDYLVSQGVDAGRLEAQGFGETQPIIVDGVEDKVASRRIEIIPQ